MFRLGLTGGIGSGKSTVCKIFSVLGIPFFSADESARIIMDNDLQLRESLNNLVGKDIYPEGMLNRKELAEIIFNDVTMLEQVNSIVHPKVFKAFIDWSNKQESDYVIMEAAILFESGGEKWVDRIVAVIAPLEERLMRVVSRNEMTREEVMARIRNQMPESELMRRADYLIDNSEVTLVMPQVLTIHNEILSNIIPKS